MESHGNANAHAEHGHPTGPYFVVFTLLMVLLAVTVGMSFVHFGHLNIPLALLVATIKAGMVIWIFMHVRESSPVVIACIAITIITLLIGITLLMADYLAR